MELQDGQRLDKGGDREKKGVKRKYSKSSECEFDSYGDINTKRAKRDSITTDSDVGFLEDIKSLKSNLTSTEKFETFNKTTKNIPLKGYKPIFKVTKINKKNEGKEQLTEQSVNESQVESVDKDIGDTPQERYFSIFVKKNAESDNWSETKLLTCLETCEKDIMELEPKIIKDENLVLSYYNLFRKGLANLLFKFLEKDITYFTGQMSQVVIFGQWRDIPRKQVAYGDEGLSYSFSGNTFPARPWTPLLRKISDIVSKIANSDFNFVLVNRYKDGQDHIGEHRDNEPDLDPDAPIASISLGQQREFLLRHRDLRFKKPTTVQPKSLQLENGSLLIMHHPTNIYWYHSLPRSKATKPRINMTFRRIVPKDKPRL